MPVGIEKLKVAIKWGLDLSEQIAEASKDGISWTDMFGFLDDAVAIPGLVKSWPDISLELHDLTEIERLELHAYVSSEFDIPHEKMEIFIENALLQVVSLVTLVEEFKALKANQ